MALLAEEENEHWEELAGRLVSFRRLREKLLPGGLAGEPAWDMLLVLFADGPAVRHSISSLCKVSCKTFTTCWRWIHLLKERGLVELTPDTHHASRIFVALSEQGESVVRECLAILDAR